MAISDTTHGYFIQLSNSLFPKNEHANREKVLRPSRLIAGGQYFEAARVEDGLEVHG